MKRFYTNVFKSKKPSLDPKHGPVPTNSTSTPITSTIDLTPTRETTANAQLTLGVNVSV